MNNLSDSTMDIFNLTQSVHHHQNILRTITNNAYNTVVSGSFDKTCAFFTKDKTNLYSFIKDTHYHDDYIYCVRNDVLNRGFFSGSKDAKIIFMDNEGNPLSEFMGHSGTVNAFSQSVESPNIFISGSWDTTAKVWDIESGKNLYTLKDHSYAVSVACLDDKSFITGSQDKKLRFWDRDRLINEVNNAHDDIIRDIIISHDKRSFYSCSNDYTIKQWTFTGELLNTLTGHDGFIFRLFMKNNFLFSAGDDKVVKIWKNGKLHQDVFHPNTVWDITVNNNDLITACADGVMRIFTTESDRWLPQNEIEEYTNMCLFSSQGKEEENPNSHVDINKLPLFSDIHKIANPKDGEISVFNNNGQAEAYVYNKSEKKWDKVGNVLGTKEGKKYYAGDSVFSAGHYDYIFDVELEGGTSKLPFDKDGNALVTAEKFIAREGLHKLYVDDITKFLRQNTKQVANTNPTPSNKPVNKQPTLSVKFPRITYNKYDSVNTDGPLKKINEINNTLVQNNDPKALNNTQLQQLSNIMDVLKKGQFYHTSSFNENEINTFTKVLGRWNMENIIPYLDTFRMYLLHPRSNDLFSKIGGGVQEYYHFVEILKSGSDTQRILILRIFNNMFINESIRIFMNDKRPDILDNVSVYLDSENKNLRNGIIGLLYKYIIFILIISYSILLCDKNDSEASLQLLSLINEILISEKDAKNCCLLLLACGNLLYNNQNNRSISSDMGIKDNLRELNIKEGNEEDLNLINELKQYLISIIK